jgi:hypothetical protein
VKNDNNAIELFELAAKYDVDDLKALTEKMMLNNLRKSNAFEILTLGNLYSSDDLKHAAFNKIEQL